MGISETAGATLGKKVGPLPVGGWAAIGIGTIVIVKLLKGGSGGGGGGSVTIPDAFAGDASDSSGAGTSGGGSTSGSGTGSGTTTPATSPPAGSPPAAPGGVRIRFTGTTHVYSLLGKLFSWTIPKQSTVYTATLFKVGSKSYYRIKYGGFWRLVPADAKTITKVQ